jgi:hypothetical protein
VSLFLINYCCARTPTVTKGRIPSRRNLRARSEICFGRRIVMRAGEFPAGGSKRIRSYSLYIRSYLS